MFFELIGFEELGKQFFKDVFKEKINFSSINFYTNIVGIEKIKDFSFDFGFLIKYIYNSNNLSRKYFSIIIHRDLNFFLLETENNAAFRTQIIEILNKNFENEFYFFPKILTIEEEWNLLKLFDTYSNLIISTNEGLRNLDEEIEGKEKFPIHSSIIDVNINENVYTVQFFNNGFNFPPG